jgi:hypothetical protein
MSQFCECNWWLILTFCISCTLGTFDTSDSSDTSDTSLCSGGEQGEVLGVESGENDVRLVTV